MAALLAARGFPDHEIMQVLDEVEASMKHQTAEIIDVLKDEGIDGLRRRLGTPARRR